MASQRMRDKRKRRVLELQARCSALQCRSSEYAALLTTLVQVGGEGRQEGLMMGAGAACASLMRRQIARVRWPAALIVRQLARVRRVSVSG